MFIEKLEENNTNSLNSIESEQEHNALTISRRSQLEQALKELNAAKTESEKELVVNAFFDLEKATIRIETAEREIANRQTALTDYSSEYEKHQQSVDELTLVESTAAERYRLLEKKKRQLTIQLDVLREFYAQHDVKVRQELAKEKELRSSIEGDLRSFADREQFMTTEIDEYKKMRKALLQKQDLATKERSQSINVNSYI